MAGLFPHAPTIAAFWQNILNGIDAVSDPPAESWDPDLHYAPDATDNDRIYCKRMGFLGPVAYFNPLDYGVMPLAVDGGEPDQWLALKIAREALADAGYSDQVKARHRTSVIIGKGTYVNRGNFSGAQHSLIIGQTLRILKTLHPEFSDSDLASIRGEFKASLPPFNAETAPALIPNIMAGRIANRLDLMGPNYTVDAACASSLIATQLGVRDLLSGECDLALVGGAQVTTPIPILSLFCQLNALSHQQVIRPFDEAADGTILGEGIGMIVLKRRADAERDGDRIYALIKGVGTASDGHGVSVMAPRVEGEELALRRAYESAGVDPRTVELIEAHGTATRVGDAAEIRALTNVFGNRTDRIPHVALGTVKSMIGHTMAASGIAGIIKAALALHHRVLPPTLHVTQPTSSLDLDTSAFYLNGSTRPWIHGDENIPRRAGVNAFGFGGINAHAVLEEYPDADESQIESHLVDWDSEVFVLSAATRDDLISQLDRLLTYAESDPSVSLKDLAYSTNTGEQDERFLVSIVASDVGDLKVKLARGRDRISDPKTRQLKDVLGLYFFTDHLANHGKIAVLFPGEGSQYASMLADLCVHFPRVREAFDQIDRIFHDHPRGFRPSDAFFPPGLLGSKDRQRLEKQLWQSDGAWEAVLTANHAMWTILSDLGLRPDVVVGHSTGEYSAMRAAGVLDQSDEAEYRQFVLALNEGYQNAIAAEGVPSAGMLAVAANREKVADLAARAGGSLYVALDNCEHQAVIVGPADDVRRAQDLAKQDGLIYEYLTYDRAYHTPLFAPYLEHLQVAFDQAKVQSANLPIFSCTTAASYPSDPAEIRRLMVDHWVEPVEFRRTIEALYDEGFRIFVEAGARGNLTTFVDDILRGRPHCAIASNVQRRSGITQLNHALAQLRAQGVVLDLSPLYRRRRPKNVDWRRPIQPGRANSEPQRKLATTLPLLQLSAELAQALNRVSTSASAPPGGDEPDLLQFSPRTAPANEHLHTQLRADLNATGRDADQELNPVSSLELSDKVSAESLSDTTTALGAPDDDWARFADYDSNEQALAMLAHLDTMDQFLTVQAEVLQAYFQQDFVDSAVLQLGQSSIGPVTLTDLTAEPCIVDTIGEGIPSSSTRRPEAPSIIERTSLADDRVTGSNQGPTGQIIEMAAGTLPESAFELASGGAMPNDLSSASQLPRSYPLIGQVISYTPGEEMVAERSVNPLDDAYLRDHTLGRHVSSDDPDLQALPVMPIMMSLELLAEAAAMVLPHLRVVGLRDIRAHRWIAFQDEPQVLMVIARRKVGHSDLVDVYVRNLTEDEESGDLPKSPVIEATVVLAAEFPPRPPPLQVSLINARPSAWRPDQLYADAMFHGPAWQGVASIEQTGDNGTRAILPVLSHRGFFRDGAAPSFVLDPVVLDAAGQVPGFWFLEHFPRGEMIFPYRVESIELYGPGRPVNENLTCTAAVELLGDRQVRSDIDVVAADGGLWIRIGGLEDLRFPIPLALQRFVLDTRTTSLSEPWDVLASFLPGDRPVAARRLVPSLRTHHRFWKTVWADCVLSRAERPGFHRLRTPDSHQLVWLAGRTAVKEVVRDLIRRQYDLNVALADIEVSTDDRGRPIVGGSWEAMIGDQASVSIAHTGTIAVAAAVLHNVPGRSVELLLPENAMRVRRSIDPPLHHSHPLLGVDVEQRREDSSDLAELILTDEEQQLFVQIAEKERTDWVLRGWCAKEAIGKALGYGLVDGPRSVRVVAADLQTGTMAVELAGQLARVYPEFATARLLAYTWVEGDLVAATTLCEVESLNDGV